MFNSALLAKLRKEQHLTLKKVADFVDVTVPYISLIEKGRVKSPSYAIVEGLAKLFRVDPKEFMTDEGLEEKEKESVVDMMALREIRFMRKWTVAEAAERARINPSTLSLIENGKRRAVSMTTLSKIAEAYSVDVNDLLLKREEYVDLTALVLQSDTVMIDGEEIDVSNDVAAERILTALKMGAAWAKGITN